MRIVGTTPPVFPAASCARPGLGLPAARVWVHPDADDIVTRTVNSDLFVADFLPDLRDEHNLPRVSDLPAGLNPGGEAPLHAAGKGANAPGCPLRPGASSLKEAA